MIGYISQNWIYHCIRLRQEENRNWTLFGGLIFRRVLPFPHRPWVPTINDHVYYKTPLHWGVINTHYSLFNQVLFTLKVSNIPAK